MVSNGSASGAKEMVSAGTAGEWTLTLSDLGLNIPFHQGSVCPKTGRENKGPRVVRIQMQAEMQFKFIGGQMRCMDKAKFGAKSVFRKKMKNRMFPRFEVKIHSTC